MIEIRNMSLRFGPQIVFEKINANISTRDRIGLAGRNGAGKTTFLKCLLGEMETDGGDIIVGKGMTLGYLPQDGIQSYGTPLLEAVKQAEMQIQELNAALEAAHDRVDRHASDPGSPEAVEAWDSIHKIEGELQLREAHKLTMRAEKVLSGLGFKETDFGRDTGEFSGGWQMRIALAKLLLRQPDYLLLDEPTNHLDLPSQRWLEQYLAKYQGGLVLISHDRAFLDELTRKTFALGQGALKVFAGNFTYFEVESAKQKALQIARKASQDKKIEQTQRFIDRFRAKNTKATQVQSRIKQLDKLERIEIDSEEASVSFSFPPAPRSGQVLISVEGLDKAYGDLVLFNSFDLKIEKGQRLAVVGVNGAGKSTLAKILAGEEPFQNGQRMVGQNTRLSYFAQHQTAYLNSEHTALESAVQMSGAGEQAARDILGSFLFRGDDVFKPVQVLSGGEKNRLALARILLQPANLLILDEPTNHLDIQSKTILREALQNYDGALMIISHDRDFLDPLVDRTLEINPQSHRMFWCNVSEYLDKVEREEHLSGPSKRPVSKGKALNPKEERRRREEERRRLAPLKKRVEAAETKMAKLEAEIAAWEDKMRDPAFFSNRPGQKADMQAYDSTKRKLERAMEVWESAQAALDEAQGD